MLLKGEIQCLSIFSHVQLFTISYTKEKMKQKLKNKEKARKDEKHVKF